MRNIIILLFIPLLLLLGFLELNYVNKTFDALEKDIVYLQSNLTDAEKSNEVLNKWKESDEQIFCLFTEHSKIQFITTKLVELNTYATQKDLANAELSATLLLSYLDSLSCEFGFGIHNII